MFRFKATQPIKDLSKKLLCFSDGLLGLNSTLFKNSLGNDIGLHINTIIADASIPEECDEKDLNIIEEFDDIITKMLQCFKEQYPNNIIKNYSLEHRLYVMNDHEKCFEGNIHDDCCPYTIICYYHIGKNIKGGELKVYDENGNILNKRVPQSGDIIIFSGEHQVCSVGTTKYISCDHINMMDTINTYPENIRGLLTIFINGGP